MSATQQPELLQQADFGAVSIRAALSEFGRRRGYQGRPDILTRGDTIFAHWPDGQFEFANRADVIAAAATGFGA